VSLRSRGYRTLGIGFVLTAVALPGCARDAGPVSEAVESLAGGRAAVPVDSRDS
jgi:hypothetical protein